MTISSWLNFGRSAPPERGSAAGRFLWVRLTTASAQCLRLSERFFHYRSEYTLVTVLVSHILSNRVCPVAATLVKEIVFFYINRSSWISWWQICGQRIHLSCAASSPTNRSNQVGTANCCCFAFFQLKEIDFQQISIFIIIISGGGGGIILQYKGLIWFTHK